MNTSIKEKINRLGRVGQIISVLLIIMAVVYFVLITYGNIASIGKPLGQDSPLLESVMEFSEESGWVDVTGSSDVSASIVTPSPEAESHFLTVYSILTTVLNAGWIVALILLKRVADGFRHCDTPFEDNVIRRMNVFAWALLGFSLFSKLVELGTGIAEISLYEEVTWALTGLSGVPGLLLRLITPSYTLVVALVVLFLVGVFRHGAELQREVDETL